MSRRPRRQGSVTFKADADVPGVGPQEPAVGGRLVGPGIARSEVFEVPFEGDSGITDVPVDRNWILIVGVELRYPIPEGSEGRDDLYFVVVAHTRKIRITNILEHHICNVDPGESALPFNVN